jgi:nicotinamide-nucleotide amidase
MQAEIIAIGSELTTGAKLDTNSQWLSLELAAVGIPVQYHSTVADDLPAIVRLLLATVNRSDLIIMTGGLGPTLDDLTRQALAEVAQAELVLHEPSLEFIRTFFARRQRAMPERNVIQAMFPAGSRPLPNPRGTAPGIWMEIGRKTSDRPCLIAALPGVPSEMKPMFFGEVLPRLRGTGNVIRRYRLNSFGLGESAVEELLGDLTARGHDPDIGITAHEATITLRITAHGQNEEDCRRKIATSADEIRRRMGDLIFGEEDEELEDVVVRLLRERGMTLATAESGTGGLLAHRLTGVRGFEDSYLGGVIAPTLAAKRDLLGVSPELMDAAGAISAEVAEAMASGCRERLGTHFALSVTEHPHVEPGPQTGDVPTTWIALAGPEILRSDRHILLGDPAIARSRAAKTALNMLRLHLLQRQDEKH